MSWCMCVGACAGARASGCTGVRGCGGAGVRGCGGAGARGRGFKRTGKRDEIFLATKFGLGHGEAVKDEIMHVKADPEYVHKACQRSLDRLGVDYIDLYYLHRADKNIPIELTVRAMAELAKAGKVKYLGLSECSENTLRRAHAVHPVSVIQVEYSPFATDIEDEKIGLLKAARELRVKVVAYAPLGRGLITGKYKAPEDFAPDDYRRQIPRFSKENFPSILRVADGLKKIGEKYGATAGQVAIAWVLAQGEDFIPIAGTTKINNLKENLGSLQIKLTPEDVAEVRKLADAANLGVGDRYPRSLQHSLFVDTPPLQQ
ncbi:NADP-dependent oxidoreductase domain-containing protein [Daedaleopsis nitida]|nr:NADP-dependent oxidoreductase domain-containing protein [Daedaleopsis nitida]